MILTPKQAFDLLMALPEPERTLTLLAAATAESSECLGLQWQDVDFLNYQISVRRTWIASKVGKPKSAASKSPVPMHLLSCKVHGGLASGDAILATGRLGFASARMKGKQHRSASILVEDYVRPAAVKVGILTADDTRRFGFPNLRHSLASFLVSVGTNPKSRSGSAPP